MASLRMLSAAVSLSITMLLGLQAELGRPKDRTRKFMNARSTSGWNM